jgi:hypothetical protein
MGSWLVPARVLHRHNSLIPHFPSCDQYHRLKRGGQVIRHEALDDKPAERFVCASRTNGNEVTRARHT